MRAVAAKVGVLIMSEIANIILNDYVEYKRYQQVVLDAITDDMDSETASKFAFVDVREALSERFDEMRVQLDEMRNGLPPLWHHLLTLNVVDIDDAADELAQFYLEEVRYVAQKGTMT